MPLTAIAFGIMLIGLGMGGYFGTGTASLTALIPAAFGLILALFGLVSFLKPGLRKHAMHAAAVLTLIGFVVSVWQGSAEITDIVCWRRRGTTDCGYLPTCHGFALRRVRRIVRQILRGSQATTDPGTAGALIAGRKTGTGT